MADRVAAPARHHLGRMLLIEAYLAVFVLFVEQHHNLVRRLYHPHGQTLEHEGHRLGPALVVRVWKDDASQRQLAFLSHDVSRPRLQDRVLVVADQRAVVARAVLLSPHQVGHWTRA
jgi:hypothetical protein